jgi:hypothetical protein
MRPSSIVRTICLTTFAVLLLTSGLSAAGIEAVKGKKYRLTKQHGPWMIMVASFKDAPEDRRSEGQSAREAANSLVYELRTKGIPAYVFSQEEIEQHINTRDRLGRQRTRMILAQQDNISVIAGNYEGVENSVAQKTLKYIKKLDPKSLKGGLYRKTPGRPGPFSGAFLTFNPLLSPEELQKRKRDPLLLKLNAGSENSLYNNKGKYSLIVASFYGRTVTKTGLGSIKLNKKSLKVDNLLDKAAEDAWILARVLKEKGFDAYVMHDRFRSIVTVGAFQSPQNPKIRQLQKNFGAKVRKNPATGQQVLTAEIISIPGRTKRDPNVRTWIFDPQPELIEVPKK